MAGDMNICTVRHLKSIVSRKQADNMTQK